MFAVFVAVIALMLSGGCAASAKPEQRVSLPTLPAPSSFSINGSGNINIPPAFQEALGLPETLTMEMEAAAYSEAISAQPLRSRHRGELLFIVTDGTGEQVYANVNLQMEGESAGSPTEGIGLVIRRFMDAASIINRPIEQLGK